MKKKKFVGFGELLVRLTPEGYLRLTQADRFNVNYTGAEGNMAVTLSHMGVPSEMVTKLPDNDIGRSAIQTLNKYGVGTSHITLGGERMGLYYLERGASQRPSKVVYDRKYSSFSTVQQGEFDWETIFENAGWFHFTGITVALSDVMSEICQEACIVARKKGLKISCDLNYRRQLWTPDEAQKRMKPLMQYVDILVGNEEDSEKVLGLKPDNSDIVTGNLSLSDYKLLTKRLADEYGFEKIAFTLRESISASVNNWSAVLYCSGEVYSSRKYMMHIVDRVGGGDSFASGLIYATLQGFTPQKIIEYATAASCLKHSIEYDFNLSTPEEVMSLVEGDGSGRVQR